MAVRPPQDDSPEPDQVAFGIAALAARLDDAEIEFPASREEIVRAIDDPEVPYDMSGNTLDVSEALAELPRETFTNRTELLDLLHPVFEQRRAAGTGTVLDRLRDLLPF